MSSRRRPYDDVKYLIAAVLGLPFLVGSVYVLLFLVRIAWARTNVLGGAATLIVGIAVLAGATYWSIELLRNSPGG